MPALLPLDGQPAVVARRRETARLSRTGTCPSPRATSSHPSPRRRASFRCTSWMCTAKCAQDGCRRLADPVRMMDVPDRCERRASDALHQLAHEHRTREAVVGLERDGHSQLLGSAQHAARAVARCRRAPPTRRRTRAPPARPIRTPARLPPAARGRMVAPARSTCRGRRAVPQREPEFSRRRDGSRRRAPGHRSALRRAGGARARRSRTREPQRAFVRASTRAPRGSRRRFSSGRRRPPGAQVASRAAYPSRSTGSGTA